MTVTPTYVYDNVEVTKTSRTATRNLPSGKIDTLIEITPNDQSIGTWKKWVREVDLFVVVGDAQ